jgi:uncharacterized membrane protein YfcA
MSPSPRRLLIEGIIGVVVGGFSGFFGIGAGLIAVPLMVLAKKMDQKSAQATSLVVVTFAATTGALTYAARDSVVWEATPIILAGGLLGSLMGSFLMNRVPVRPLQVLFGIVLIIAAARLIFQSFDSLTGAAPDISGAVIAGYFGTGIVTGTISALLGIGGGIIAVPLLISGFGFAHQLAAGTSLAVMVPIAIVGAWRQTGRGFTKWRVGLNVGIPAGLGAAGAAWIALRIDPSNMQVALAILLATVAIFIIVKSIIPPRKIG